MSVMLMLAFLVQQSSCNKNCVETTYSFELPIKAHPNLDSINIGDTVWLEINEPTTLKNFDGRLINYSSAENLGSVVAFQKIDSINKTFIESVEKFNYKLEKGNELRRTSLDIEYGFIESNNQFVFKLAIVPKETGVFRLSVGSSNNTYTKQDKCTKANFIINFKETISHDYYIRLINPAAPINIAVTNGYFFKVK
jgi:hypothetical protein